MGKNGRFVLQVTQRPRKIWLWQRHPVESERLQQALDACVVPLRTLARYQLEPPLVQRLEAMGERKEFLSPEEHAELIALVEFARRRQIEKLQAEVALERLRSTFPDLVETT